MRHAFKILLFVVVFFSVLFTYADRGIRSKSRNRILLNISNKTTFKNSLQFNLKNGLKFKGLISSDYSNTEGQPLYYNMYHKGNTTYLLPNKTRFITPEVKQGYTGMKLVIKSR